jgi:hypothetical protein
MTNQLEISTKIEQATSKENKSYSHNSAWAINSAKDDGVFIAATDGKIAAITKEAGSVRAPVSLPKLVANPPKKGHKATLSDNDMWTTSSGKAAPSQPFDKNPPKMSLVLKQDSLDSDKNVRLAINADLLKRLSQAIGNNDRINLIIQVGEEGEVKKPIVVTPYSDKREAVGLIMPLAREADQTERYNQIADQYIESEKLADIYPQEVTP